MYEKNLYSTSFGTSLFHFDIYLLIFNYLSAAELSKSHCNSLCHQKQNDVVKGMMHSRILSCIHIHRAFLFPHLFPFILLLIHAVKTNLMLPARF